jgi:hypothetical protein
MMQGVSEETSEIVYNRHNLLTRRITTSATGAYSWTDWEYVSYDLRTGNLIDAVSFFKPGSIAEIQKYVATELNRNLQEEMEGREKEEVEMMRELGTEKLNGVRTGKSLYEFYLTDNSLVFDVDWGFPHAMQALAPPDEVAIPFNKLIQWVEPGGPLGFILAK